VKTKTVQLSWETAKGCKGTTVLGNVINISRKPQADFTSLTGTTVCGPTEVTFQATGSGFHDGYWFVNGGRAFPQFNDPYTKLRYKFSDTGTYTIQFVAVGNCNDTVTRTDYIRVLPPFVGETTYQTNCTKREEVTLTQNSRYAQTLLWDFGDGQTLTGDPNQSSIKHTYSGTGYYRVELTATNAQCTFKNVVWVSVLSKQTPVLSTTNGQVCQNGVLNFTLSNLEENPVRDQWSRAHYYIERVEYNDGTYFNGTIDRTAITQIPHTGWLSNLAPGKTSLRMILREATFGCLDTSNYIPIVVKSTNAGFRVLNNNGCFTDSVRFQDTSKVSAGNSIIQWQWNFGDGQTLNLPRGGTVSHLFANPGNYNVTLTVTDASGCNTTTPYYLNVVTVNGPKAAFTAPATAPFNSVVFFNNTTNDFSYYRATYQWDFGDGNTSTVRSPQHTFTTPDQYTIRLTAKDPVTGCTSTATQQIDVQLVNAYFNFTRSMIGQTSCPPVLTNFTVTAFNVDSLSWDFGDGSTAGDLRYASHVYEKPGKYIVTLTARGANGIIYRYLDSVIIKQPTVSVSADDWDGCIGHTINLNLTSTYARNYAWDFGDGTVTNSQTSGIAHTYNVAGTYTPSLLVTDSSGCTMYADLKNKVIIFPNPDITVSPAAAQACLGTPVQLSASGAQNYLWSPATGLNDPTSAQPIATPAQTTTYRVAGVDARGCRNYTNYTLTVRKPFDVQVASQVEICEGKDVMLQVSGAHSYKWINTTAGLSDVQSANPVASPTSTTTYTVVGYDAYGCFTDTATVLVTVNPKPAVNAGQDADAMPGDPVQLSATGSSDIVKWTWSPNSYLSCVNCPAPLSKPMASMNYKVTGTTAKGCEASDEVVIKMQCNESRIRIPNAFTPNGDPHNSRFKVKGVSVIRHMVIYNRWGNKVFERSNFIADDASGWDGTYMGVAQPVGGYVYVVEFQCPGGEVFVKRGTVILLR